MEASLLAVAGEYIVVGSTTCRTVAPLEPGHEGMTGARAPGLPAATRPAPLTRWPLDNRSGRGGIHMIETRSWQERTTWIADLLVRRTGEDVEA